MAPTLEDVSYLLGLPLAGEPIGPLEAPDEWAVEIRERFTYLCDGAPWYEGEAHGPKLEWLNNFQVSSPHLIFVISYASDCIFAY